MLLIPFAVFFRRVFSFSNLHLAKASPLSFLQLAKCRFLAKLQLSIIFRVEGKDFWYETCASQVLNGTSLRREAMLDVLLLATTVIFFAIAWAYMLGCDRL